MSTMQKRAPDDKFSYMYSNLVENEDDVVGLIAYSLYKSAKIQFVIDYEAKNEGKTPSDTDKQNFHSHCFHQLEYYKEIAEQRMNTFSQMALGEVVQELEENYNKKFNTAIKNWKPSFWIGVFQSLFAAFISFLVIGVIIIFIIGMRHGTATIAKEALEIILPSYKLIQIPEATPFSAVPVERSENES